MVVTRMETRGVGWSVYDMKNRRKLAGPFKGPKGQHLAASIELALRNVDENDAAGIKAVIDRLVAA